MSVFFETQQNAPSLSLSLTLTISISLTLTVHILSVATSAKTVSVNRPVRLKTANGAPSSLNWPRIEEGGAAKTS